MQVYKVFFIFFICKCKNVKIYMEYIGTYGWHKLCKSQKNQ